MASRFDCRRAKWRVAWYAIVALALGGPAMATGAAVDVPGRPVRLAATGPPEAKASSTSSTAPRTLAWENLLPAGSSASADPGPPPPMDDYLSGGSDLAARQVLDFSVVSSLDGQLVRLPGYVVPLELSGDGKVTDLLFVPFLGACIHVPPPPPNQILYVHASTGIALASMNDPYWVTGRLSTQVKRSRIGAAAYSMEGATLETYKY
jgi:uncharacterized protein